MGGRPKTVPVGSAAGRWARRRWRLPAQSPPRKRRACEAGGPPTGRTLDPAPTGRFVSEDGADCVQACVKAVSSPALGPPRWPVQSMVGSATVRVQRRVWESPPYKLAENALRSYGQTKSKKKNKSKTKHVTTGHPKEAQMPVQTPAGNRPPRRCSLTRHAAAAWPPEPGEGGSAWPPGPSAGPAGSRPRQTGCPGQRPSYPCKRRS